MPDRLLHEGIFEFHEVGDGVGLGGEGRDVVRLEAVDELAHVVRLALYGRENGAVSNRAVGAEEDQVVWEVRGGDAEVGLRLLGPDVLEVGALGVDDGEPRLERGVEAGGADEDVEGVFDAVIAFTSPLCYFANLAVDDVHVGFPQGFEVPHAGREAATADGPVGDEAFFQVRILQFFVHLLAEVGLCFGVRVCVFEEDAELAV